MGTIKKNPIFCAVVVVCILAFCAGAFLAITEASKASDAKKSVKSAMNQLSNVAYSEPTPNDSNVEASEANVIALRSDLKAIQDDLQSGSSIDTSLDGISVMASIQQYISEYQSKVENHTDVSGEPSPIYTPDNFAFGFERYIGEAAMLANEETIPLLDKQRQILVYLMDNLIKSDPSGIEVVQRELVEVSQRTGQTDAKTNGFEISSEVSARVPDAINTLAFKLTFTGYTQSLRSFLNALSQFEMPIVVRSVTVDRVSGRPAAPQARQRNNLDDIFSAFGGATQSSAVEELAPEQKPVITDNISTFTVVLEFIEIVIPSETEENPA